MEPAVKDAAWTLARLLTWTTDYLKRSGVEDARLSAEVLLAYAAHCRRIDVYARFDQCLPAEQLDRFRDLVKRAAAHEPIAYLVALKEFYSLEFRVTGDVLIPRPETEALVEASLDRLPARTGAPIHVLDVATGSGCIVISLLKENSSIQAVATDVSEAALAVARSNAERHGVQDRVTFVHADGLAIAEDVKPSGGFHALVCNPPYISAEGMATVPTSVARYEPRIALTDGADGLTFYRMLARKAQGWLADGGFIAMEIADGAVSAVQQVFDETGGWKPIQAVRDRVTGLERVVMYSPDKR